MSRQRGNGEGTVYQRADGRWEAAGFVDLPDGTRRRVRVYAATRNDAVRALAERTRDAGRGTYSPDSGGVTVGEYLEVWLVTVAAHRLRESTFETYHQYTRRFILPYLGHRALTALSPKDVRGWVDRLRSDCQCCRQGFDAKRPTAKRRCCTVGDCCRKVLSSATIAYTHGILRTALGHAVREEELPRNVAKMVQAPVIRSARTEPWSASEARRFLAHARANERFAVAYELALRSGLRIGELLALSWDDVDFAAGTIRVRRSVRRHLNGKGLVLSEPKTQSSRRRIPLPPGCAALLRGHRLAQRAERATAGEGWRETGLVFTTLLGTTVDPVHLSRYFGAACHCSGVRRIRFHDLRHTCATLMLESGADLVTVKDLLGHSRIQITADVYMHVRLKVTRSALDAMGDMLGDESPEAEDGDPPDALSA